MNEHLVKILIVGDGDVGKSSFVHRYISGAFNKTYKMTVGGTAARVGPCSVCVCVCVRQLPGFCSDTKALRINGEISPTRSHINNLSEL